MDAMAASSSENAEGDGGHEQAVAESSTQISDAAASEGGPTPIIADSGAPSIQLLDIRIAENQMLSDFYERKVSARIHLAHASQHAYWKRSMLMPDIFLVPGLAEIYCDARSARGA